jgi:hypothetical protein
MSAYSWAAELPTIHNKAIREANVGRKKDGLPQMIGFRCWSQGKSFLEQPWIIGDR